MKNKIKEKLKKIVISLITSLIAFQSIFTTNVQAVDIGGILFKPTGTILAVCIASIDVTLGAFLKGPNQVLKDTGDIIEKLKEEGESGNDYDESKFDEITADSGTKLSEIIVGPDTIFSGDIDILNANIFQNYTAKNSNNWWEKTVDNVTPSLGQQLRKMVSGIYVILRNICAIILLIALIIVGIKILISTNRANDRAQWMMLLQDWVVGLALLVFSHIIMTTIFYISDTLVDALKGSLGNGNFVKELLVQCFRSWDGAEQIIYLIMLAWLLYLTIVFALSYFKRLFYVCLLTILAPVTSVMYAFGRGTKQIYQKWFKDYCVTVFIQPIHVIMYYVLISIPIGIASSNTSFSLTSNGSFRLVYALIGLSFIKKFEKAINELFGLNQGIAAVASADSGRKDLTNIVKAIGVAVAAAVTGGAAAEIAGAGAAAGAGTAEAGAAGITEAGTTEIAETGAAESEGLGAADNSLNGINWNSELNSDQIDELKAEGLEPGDQEYLQYLNNHGIKPTDEDKGIRNIDTKEEIGSSGSSSAMAKAEVSGAIGENKLGQTLSLDNVSTVNLNGNPSINNLELDKNNQEQSKDNQEQNKILNESTDNKIRMKEDNIGVNNEEVEAALKDQGKSKARLLLEKGVKTAKDKHEFLDAPQYREAKSKISDSILALDANMYATIGGGMGNTADRSMTEAVKGKYDEKTKKKKESMHNNFTNNEGNINYIIQKDNMMQKLRQQYPKKDPGEIREMAETKAKAKLEKMTPYVDMGLKDVKTISALYDVQKEKGLSPEETLMNVKNGIKEEKNFEAFNKDPNNVQYINQKYNLNVSKVSDKIANASEIKHEGVNNIQKMDRVSQIQQETGLNPHLAVVAEKAIGRVEKKGQKIVLPKGSSPELKRVVEQLNNMNFD